MVWNSEFQSNDLVLYLRLISCLLRFKLMDLLKEIWVKNLFKIPNQEIFRKLKRRLQVIYKTDNPWARNWILICFWLLFCRFLIFFFILKTHLYFVFFNLIIKLLRETLLVFISVKITHESLISFSMENAF